MVLAIRQTMSRRGPGFLLHAACQAEILAAVGTATRSPWSSCPRRQVPCLPVPIGKQWQTAWEFETIRWQMGTHLPLWEASASGFADFRTTPLTVSGCYRPSTKCPRFAVDVGPRARVWPALQVLLHDTTAAARPCSKGDGVGLHATPRGRCGGGALGT